jgi:hypothetical protein
VPADTTGLVANGSATAAGPLLNTVKNTTMSAITTTARITGPPLRRKT